MLRNQMVTYSIIGTRKHSGINTTLLDDGNVLPGAGDVDLLGGEGLHPKTLGQIMHVPKTPTEISQSMQISIIAKMDKLTSQVGWL